MLCYVMLYYVIFYYIILSYIIFAGPSALGVLNHSNQSFILYVLTPPLTPPRGGPGAQSRCTSASLWHLDGCRSVLEPSRTVSGTPCWLMLGICWLQVASSWFQDGSRSLDVGSSWPQDVQNGPQRSPKHPKMRPKWLEDGFQIDMF